MELTVRTSKPYDILIERGSLRTIGARCAALFPAGAKAAVVSDSSVFPLYGETVMGSLRAAGFAPASFVFPAGESSKTLATVSELLGFLAEQGLTRSDFVVALGGGVTGDMAGFAAACYLRRHPLRAGAHLAARAGGFLRGREDGRGPAAGQEPGRGRSTSPPSCSSTRTRSPTLPPLFFADGMGEVIKYGCIRRADSLPHARDGRGRRPAHGGDPLLLRGLQARL